MLRLMVTLAVLLLYCGNLCADIERLLLITGCSRSGTKYITKVMNAAGLDIKHEQIGPDGSCSWLMAVESKKVPYFGAPRSGIQFTHIFHQVRHPLKVISSVYANEPFISMAFIMKFIPEITWDDTRLVKCAKFWVYWNQLVDREAEWTYRVEDIANVWDEFQQRIGRELDRSALETVSDHTNHRLSYKEFTWEDLERQLDSDLYQKVRDLAEFYGYSLS